jgi:hypothetical protein
VLSSYILKRVTVYVSIDPDTLATNTLTEKNITKIIGGWVITGQSIVGIIIKFILCVVSAGLLLIVYFAMISRCKRKGYINYYCDFVRLRLPQLYQNKPIGAVDLMHVGKRPNVTAAAAFAENAPRQNTTSGQNYAPQSQSGPAATPGTSTPTQPQQPAGGSQSPTPTPPKKTPEQLKAEEDERQRIAQELLQFNLQQKAARKKFRDDFARATVQMHKHLEEFTRRAPDETLLHSLRCKVLEKNFRGCIEKINPKSVAVRDRDSTLRYMEEFCSTKDKAKLESIIFAKVHSASPSLSSQLIDLYAFKEWLKIKRRSFIDEYERLCAQFANGATTEDETFRRITPLAAMLDMASSLRSGEDTNLLVNELIKVCAETKVFAEAAEKYFAVQFDERDTAEDKWRSLYVAFTELKEKLEILCSSEHAANDTAVEIPRIPICFPITSLVACKNRPEIHRIFGFLHLIHKKVESEMNELKKSGKFAKPKRLAQLDANGQADFVSALESKSGSEKANEISRLIGAYNLLKNKFGLKDLCGRDSGLIISLDSVKIATALQALLSSEGKDGDALQTIESIMENAEPSSSSSDSD